MVVVEAHETRPPGSTLIASADGNVLIEEARRRHRRRQLRIAAAGLAGAALAAGLIAAFAPRGSSMANVPVGASQFSNYVAAATRDAGTADVSIVLGTTFPPGFPGCQSQETTGTGTIDFRTNSIGLSLANHGVGLCGGPFFLQMRQLGPVLYTTDPSTRHVLTSPGKPWLKTPWTSPEVVPGFGNGGIRAGAEASFIFTALDSLRSPVTPMGTMTLHGSKVSGYRGTATLADLQSASQAQARATGVSFENLQPPGGSIPPAAGIPIAVAFWLDSHGRIRQVSASEALYTLNYADGSGAIGPQIYPSEYLGRNGNTAVHQQGAIELTITLTNFGTTETISPPPPSRVTTGVVR